MTSISDPRFLHTFGRRFYSHSRLFVGGSIAIVERAGTLEIHIGNGLATMVCLGWRDGEAFIVEPYTHPRYRDDQAFGDLADALTDFVGKFLRRHRLINTKKTGVA